MNNANQKSLLNSIQAAAAQTNGSYLTYEKYRELTGVPMSRVLLHFDSWTDACRAAGVQPGQASPDNITPKHSKGKEHALNEVRKVAESLGVSTLSKSQFDNQHPEVKAATVARLCGGWPKVLKAAGLNSPPDFREEISLEELSEKFLEVISELDRVPTLVQLTRRSGHCKHTFTRKFGGHYSNFQRAAIDFLIGQDNIPNKVRKILEGHQSKLDSSKPESEPITTITHSRGRHLGFRAFAFSSTNEDDVISLFGAVADELGFEIISNRPAFPDCEARRLTDRKRKRYKTCLIEYELQSKDYLKHGHPINGCDLIVCWEHNWKDCPIEVLELKSKIRNLPGWK